MTLLVECRMFLCYYFNMVLFVEFRMCFYAITLTWYCLLSLDFFYAITLT